MPSDTKLVSSSKIGGNREICIDVYTLQTKNNQDNPSILTKHSDHASFLNL